MLVFPVLPRLLVPTEVLLDGFAEDCVGSDATSFGQAVQAGFGFRIELDRHRRASEKKRQINQRILQMIDSERLTA